MLSSISPPSVYMHTTYISVRKSTRAAGAVFDDDEE